MAREEAGEAASCTAEGSHTVITECADCGEELSRESVTDKALGHDYRETARTEASYNAEGSVTYTCSRCGDGFTDILPMLQNEDGQADGQQAETGSGEQSDVTQPVDEQDEECSVLRNDVRAGDECSVLRNDVRAGDEISPWAELQSTLDNVSEVVLMDDYTAGADDAALVIPADSTVILDLNGHTLNRNLTSEEENGSVIINNGRLTITGEGKITGSYSSGSGGAIVNYGTLTISGGRKLGTVLLFLSPKHQSPLFWSAKILMTRFPFGSLKFSQLPLRNTRTGPSFALRESSDD